MVILHIIVLNVERKSNGKGGYRNPNNTNSNYPPIHTRKGDIGKLKNFPTSLFITA